MEWVVYAVVVLAAAAASYYAAQRAQRMSNATMGKIEAPTAEDGKPIPWLFGTREIAGANVEWYGDVRADPIQK